MATRLEPIRIGDTFITSFTFYDPLPEADWADPDVPEADTDSPQDLTGITITFNAKNGTTTRTFTTTPGVNGGVMVTPLLGQIDIELEAAQTAVFTVDVSTETYLQFTYAGGNVKTKAHQERRVIRKESL